MHLKSLSFFYGLGGYLFSCAREIHLPAMSPFLPHGHQRLFMGWPWETEGKVHEAGRSPTVGSPGGSRGPATCQVYPPGTEISWGTTFPSPFVFRRLVDSRTTATKGERKSVPGSARVVETPSRNTRQGLAPGPLHTRLWVPTGQTRPKENPSSRNDSLPP